MNHYKSLLKVVPLLIVLAVIYKLRFKLKLAKAPDEITEAIDSSYYYHKPKEIEAISHGTIMNRPFNGIDATKHKVEHLMNSGMDMISNDQYYLIKLYDKKQEIEVYIAIRDFRLLEKIPFQSHFEDGEKVLVTAFVKDAVGVNAMFGGTIYNNESTLKLTGFNKSKKTISGVLDAKLQAVTANGYCRIENLVFTNAIADFSN
ncbi:MAG: hypothetical protein U0U67_01215 [Chitinophagales bacterium]